MRFRFDANQEYQLQAIAAVKDLFEGQPRVGAYNGDATRFPRFRPRLTLPPQHTLFPDRQLWSRSLASIPSEIPGDTIKDCGLLSPPTESHIIHPKPAFSALGSRPDQPSKTVFGVSKNPAAVDRPQTVSALRIPASPGGRD